MRRQITLACAVYDRTIALADSSVAAEGLDINFVPLPHGELFRRQGRFAEFDAAEFSLATYAVLRGRGDRRLIGIPVFPSRMFRHSSVYVNTSSGIRTPKDLIGKRVGTQEYQQTAGVWLRGILADEYGVAPRDLHWFFGAYDQPGRYDPRVQLRLPVDVRTETIPPTRSLDELLQAGEIDALTGAQPPVSFSRGAPNVARLFPEYEQEEREYFKHTRIFPIMHLVVIRREVYEQAPWVATSLYKAFLRAKDQARRRLSYPGATFVMLPWLIRHLDATREVMGEDPYAYGVEANRKALETFLRYCTEQGLVEGSLNVEELFAPETLTAPEMLEP